MKERGNYNMQAKLMGTKALDFKNDAGEQIKGLSTYWGLNDSNVQGVRTEKFFLNKDMSLPEGTKIGDTLELSFNDKGKIEKIEKA